jgi:conjugal transfer/entry exclusion protein
MSKINTDFIPLQKSRLNRLKESINNFDNAFQNLDNVKDIPYSLIESAKLVIQNTESLQDTLPKIKSEINSVKDTIEKIGDNGLGDNFGFDMQTIRDAVAAKLNELSIYKSKGGKKSRRKRATKRRRRRTNRKR